MWKIFKIIKDCLFKKKKEQKYTLFWYRYDGDQTYNLKRDYEFYQ